MIRFARFILWLVVLLASGVAGLIVFLWIRHNHIVTLPTPTGPYRVGRIEYDWTDRSRVDPFAPSPRQKRKLPVWLWYPSRRVSKG